MHRDSSTPQDVVKAPLKLAFGPPNRVSFKTPDGWATREWNPGERETYQREVLGWA